MKKRLLLTILLVSLFAFIVTQAVEIIGCNCRFVSKEHERDVIHFARISAYNSDQFDLGKDTSGMGIYIISPACFSSPIYKYQVFTHSAGEVLVKRWSALSDSLDKLFQSHQPIF